MSCRSSPIADLAQSTNAPLLGCTKGCRPQACGADWRRAAGEPDQTRDADGEQRIDGPEEENGVRKRGGDEDGRWTDHIVSILIESYF